MGEVQNTQFRLSFNGSVRIEGRGERLTADGGALLLREVDEKLGVTEWLASNLTDTRDPRFIEHSLPELLRARLYAMGLGRGAQDDLDYLRTDPAMLLGVSDDRGLTPLQGDGASADSTPTLASQPTQSRLVEMLSSEENLATLALALFESARRDLELSRRTPLPAVTLDIDSTAIEVHGVQAGSAYNGHYRVRCYHPLFVMLADTHHWLAAKLRPGNVHTAEGCLDELLPLIDQVEGTIAKVARVRGDAGFPEETLLSNLDAREIGYAFRIRSNAALERIAQPFVSAASTETALRCHDLRYRARSWSRSRRVVLVVVPRPGELFPDHFFVLTGWDTEAMSAPDVLEFYRQRGTLESHLGELKSAFAPALSCTSRPKSHVLGSPIRSRGITRDAQSANAATLLLYVLSCNLLNTVRRVASTALPLDSARHWSLGRVRKALLTVGLRVIISARRAVLIVNASVAALWHAFLNRLARAHHVRPNTS